MKIIKTPQHQPSDTIPVKEKAHENNKYAKPQRMQTMASHQPASRQAHNQRPKNLKNAKQKTIIK